MTGFGRLLTDLNDAGVGYVVVGGIAVIRHGVVRATNDVDVVVAPDDATASALTVLIASWSATRPDGSPERRSLPTPGWPLHLRTRHGLPDLLADQAPPKRVLGFVADERRRPGGCFERVKWPDGKSTATLDLLKCPLTPGKR